MQTVHACLQLNKTILLGLDQACEIMLSFVMTCAVERLSHSQGKGQASEITYLIPTKCFWKVYICSVPYFPKKMLPGGYDMGAASVLLALELRGWGYGGLS